MTRANFRPVDVSERPADTIPVSEACKLIPSKKPGKNLRIETLYRWLRDGVLRKWRIGGVWHVSRADILALPEYYAPKKEVEQRVKRRLEMERANEAASKL